MLSWRKERPLLTRWLIKANSGFKSLPNARDQTLDLVALIQLSRQSATLRQPHTERKDLELLLYQNWSIISADFSGFREPSKLWTPVSFFILPKNRFYSSAKLYDDLKLFEVPKLKQRLRDSPSVYWTNMMWRGIYPSEKCLMCWSEKATYKEGEKIL